MSGSFAAVDPESNPLINPNYPSSAPWHGAVGQRGVIDAYCSLVPSQTDGRLFAPLGGGHGDYAGNEGYSIDLLAESPAWKMLDHPPSGAVGYPAVAYADGNESTGVYSDGRIRAIHNYNNLLHIAGRGIFLANVSAPFYDPAPANKPLQAYWIHPETGAHSLASDYSGLPAQDTSGSGSGGTCYDPTRDAVWHMRVAVSMNKMLKTSLATGVTTSHGTADSRIGSGASFVYVPGHDLVVNLHSTAALMLFNPATDAWRSTVTVTGAPATGMEAFLGANAVWVPSLGGIAIWNQVSNTTVITLLTPPPTNAFTGTWAYSTLPVAPANTVTPTTRPANSGTLGKFGYLPALKGFYLQTRVADPMYFYALE